MTQIERLGGMVEETIRHIRNEGLEPTAALLKVAGSHSLRPSDVDFVAAQVNTSRHLAHMMKTAGAERLASFPLADPLEVNATLGTAVPEPPAITEDTPDLLAKEGRCGGVRKKASAEAVLPIVRGPRPSLARTLGARIAALREQGAVLHDLGENLHRAEAEAAALDAAMRRAFAEDAAAAESGLRREIEAMGDLVGRRAESERRSFARRLCARFGGEGQALVRCVWHTAGVSDELPEVGHAAAAVFPAEPLYVQAARAVDSARRLGVLKENLALLKSASPDDDYGIGAEVASLAAPAALAYMAPSSPFTAALALGSRQLAEDSRKDMTKADLSLPVRAKLQKLRNRSAFMGAVLNDPNLRGYPLKRLATAFNDAVQNDPSVTRNPAMLRGSIYQLLASPVPDMFALKTMGEVGKTHRTARDAMVRSIRESRQEAQDYAKDFAKSVADQDEAYRGMRETGEKIAADKAKERRARVSDMWESVRKGWNPATNIDIMKETSKKIREDFRKAATEDERRRQADLLFDRLTPEERARAVEEGGFKSEAAMRKAVRDRVVQSDVSELFGQSVDPLARTTKALKAAEDKRIKPEQQARMDQAGTLFDNMSDTDRDALRAAGGFADDASARQAFQERAARDAGFKVGGQAVDPVDRAAQSVVEAAARAEALERVQFALKGMDPAAVQAAMKAGNYKTTDEMAADMASGAKDGRIDLLGVPTDPREAARSALKTAADAASGQRKAVAGVAGDIEKAAIGGATPEGAGAARKALQDAGVDVSRLFSDYTARGFQGTAAERAELENSAKAYGDLARDADGIAKWNAEHPQDKVDTTAILRALATQAATGQADPAVLAKASNDLEQARLAAVQGVLEVTAPEIQKNLDNARLYGGIVRTALPPGALNAITSAALAEQAAREAEAIQSLPPNIAAQADAAFRQAYSIGSADMSRLARMAAQRASAGIKKYHDTMSSLAEAKAGQALKMYPFLKADL